MQIWGAPAGATGGTGAYPDVPTLVVGQAKAPTISSVAISHPVTVQGVQGLYVGDNTGIASAVIWQKDGMMFEVIGSFTESQALLIANSMR